MRSGMVIFMKEEFIRLYTGVYKDLYRFALYSLHNEADAEDAVSEAVVDAYAGFAKLRDQGAFRSWIFTILSAKCRRRLKEYVDKTLPLPEEAVSAEEGSAPPEYPDRLISRMPDVEGKMVLWEAFGQLEKTERLIVSLSVIGGYEGREIARELSMNHNTVRTVRRRALEKLRRMLEREESR